MKPLAAAVAWLLAGLFLAAYGLASLALVLVGTPFVLIHRAYRRLTRSAS